MKYWYKSVITIYGTSNSAKKGEVIITNSKISKGIQISFPAFLKNIYLGKLHLNPEHVVFCFRQY